VAVPVGAPSRLLPIDHDAAADYLSGASIRAVARAHGCAYATAHRLLDRRGLIRRGATSGPGGIVAAGLFLAMLAASAPAEVARRLGYSSQAVRQRARRLAERLAR
jgi:transposase-like protein